MSTPDQMAADYDPAAIPPPPVSIVGDLTGAHIGLTVDTCGVTGELMTWHLNDKGTLAEISVQEADRPFITTFEVHVDRPCEIVDEDLVQLTDVIGMEDFFALARDLDRVSQEIRNSKSAIEALTERKRKLSEKMLGTFAQVGESTLAFTNSDKARRAYIHHEIVPEFEEKDDGAKYTYRDLVPILRELGREEQITEATVGYRTLQGFLREVKEGVIPMPPKMAAMVKIGERVEVRTGVGRRSSR